MSNMATGQRFGMFCHCELNINFSGWSLFDLTPFLTAIQNCAHHDEECFMWTCVTGVCKCFTGWSDVQAQGCTKAANSSFTCRSGNACNEFSQFECEFGYAGPSCDRDLYPDANYTAIRPVHLMELSHTPSNVTANPFYKLAAFYNTLETSQFRTSIPETEIVTGRGSIGAVYMLRDWNDWLDPIQDNLGSEGDADFVQTGMNCERGFAMALWVLLETQNRNKESFILYAGTDVSSADSPHVGIVLDASERLRFRVNNGSSVWTITVHSRQVPWNNWFSIGLTWRPDEDLHAYINGHHVTGTSAIVGLPQLTASVASPLWKVIIGGRGERPSASPMSVSDFVIWDRFLFDLEKHRFLGVTAEELGVLHGADYMWSTDAHIRRDHTAIEGQRGISATGDILLRGSEFPLNLVPGRDSKGLAIELDAEQKEWIVVGEPFTGQCLSDPSLCPNGISIALWAKLHQPPSDSSYAFIFSTGGQSSRGCALYHRGSDRLRAVVADGKREWIVEIKFIVNPDRWIHLGVSWSSSVGLVLYIDGDIRAVDSTGILRLRGKDLDSRLLVGRRNDYLAGYSSITLEQMAVWKKFIEPWHARNLFGLIDNRQYVTAKHYWNTRRLISSTLGYGKKLANVDPSATVLNGHAVDLSLPGSYITLGDFPTSCTGVPSLCVEGFSLSLWLKFEHGGSSSNERFTVVRTGWFSIYVLMKDVVAVVGTLDGTWEISKTLPQNKWAHVAFVWSRVEGLALYVNGIKSNSTVSTNLGRSAGPSLLQVGSPEAAPRYPAVFHVHNVAVWERYTYPRKANRLLGMSESEYHCYTSGDFCWTFEQPMLIRGAPFKLSKSGAALHLDRKHQGTAVCTDGVRGWVSAGEGFANQCPVNPTACDVGFVIAMWIKLSSTGKSGYLLSVGAEKSDDRGVSLYQSTTGIRVKVVDSSFTWRTKIESSQLTFDQWIYLEVTWSRLDQSLAVSISGVVLPSLLLRVKGSYRSNNHASTIMLGKSSYGNYGFTSACYDDILLRRLTSDLTLPAPVAFTDDDRYPTADEHFGMTVMDGAVTAVNTLPTTDRYGFEASAIDTAATAHQIGYIDLGNYGGRCMSDPSLCTEAGVTISTWLTIDDIRETGWIFSSGAYRRGFRVNRGQNNFIYAFVLDGTTAWSVHFRCDFGMDWVNVALTWSTGGGLAILINGTQKGYNTTGGPLVVPRSTLAHHNNLVLGKRIGHRDTGYLGAVFDDFAIWYYIVENTDIIRGVNEYRLEVSAGKHDELEQSSPDTAKKPCVIIHEADCATNVQDLFFVVQDDASLKGDALLSTLRRLKELTGNVSAPLSGPDLDAATRMVQKLSNQELPDRLNETQAASDLADFLEIVNNLMDPAHTDDWISVQRTNIVATTSLMKSVEVFTRYLNLRIQHSNNNTFTEVFVNQSNIFSNLIVTPVGHFNNQTDLVLPRRYSTSTQQPIINDKWQLFNDNIVIIPAELFNFNGGQSEALSFAVTLFDSLYEMVPVLATKDFTTVEGKPLRVNSQIISVQVEPQIPQPFGVPIVITLKHKTPVFDVGHETPVCAYWNFNARYTNGAWDSDGCELKKTNLSYTVCECCHMRHFAVVMQPIPDEVYNADAVILRWLVRCLVGLSGFLLVVILITYIHSKRLHTLRHSIHLNVSIACFMASLAFALSELASQHEILCTVCGAAMQFFYLAFILWLTMELVQLYRDTATHAVWPSDATKGFAVWRHGMRYYMIGAWGIPALSVGSMLAVYQRAYQPQTYDLCWLVEDDGITWSFTAPCCVALCVNMGLLITVVRSTDGTVRRRDRTTGFRSSVRSTCVLSVLFAVTWLVGYQSIYGGPLWTDYIFIISNSLTGFFVFVLQGLGNVELNALLCGEDPDVELCLVNDGAVPQKQPSDCEENNAYLS